MTRTLIRNLEFITLISKFRKGMILVYAALVCAAPAKAAPFTVQTHLYNTYRTGWNSDETVLTPAVVSSGSFGLLGSVAVDEQVDAQPLVVPNEDVVGDPNEGKHDVVYIVTENNTVYAIDPTRRTILTSRNLGLAAPPSQNCGNNSRTVGINSTPVIDVSQNAMFVVVYTGSAGATQFVIHKLSLYNLSDLVTPQTVTASQTLIGGSQASFNPNVQRQRSALLETNGTIYAAFASFCDFNASTSRGWFLGWNSSSLAPLASNTSSTSYPASTNISNLLNKLSTGSFFLTSVWMSGAGPAVDGSGNILFATGNSSASGIYGNPAYNLPESVIKWSSANSILTDFYTTLNVTTLNQEDGDLGSGGILVLPYDYYAQNLALIDGKDGLLRLLNESNLGENGTPGHDAAITLYSLGACWCAPSAFPGTIVVGTSQANDPSNANSTGVVSIVYINVNQSNINNDTISVAASLSLPSGQDPGFFTSISSNGTANPIGWAVTRPVSNTLGLHLYAFSIAGVTPTIYFSGQGPAWPNGGANANTVPVVANGFVYVAGYKSLYVFGVN